MDGTRFDLLTQRLIGSALSRRGALRLAVGGGLGLLGFSQVVQEALACRRNKKPCAKGKRNGDCCSGTCKKGKCRPTPGAAGCTVNGGDACKGQGVRCPQNQNGSCLLLDNGKPFCIEGANCEPCTTNASCTARPNGKCLKTCPICSTTNNQGCFYPQV